MTFPVAIFISLPDYHRQPPPAAFHVLGQYGSIDYGRDFAFDPSRPAAARLTADEERTAVRALRRFERRCYLVAVTDAILARVRRPFPVEPIRTLDAVHLATTELLGEPPPLIVVVTRDVRIRENAEALGYAVE